MSTNTTLKIQPAQLINNQDGNLTTTSLIIADAFGKRHDNVIREIESLDCSDEFSLLNFEETPYTHPQNGQTYKIYKITEKGFMILAMGFTGKKAMAWKEAFINAFENMRQQQAAPVANPHLKLKSLIAKICLTNKTNYQHYYRQLNKRYQVASYKDIKPELIAEAITFLESISSKELTTVQVDRHNLKALLNLLQMQNENLSHFINLEKSAIYHIELMQTLATQSLNLKYEITNTREKMNDCIRDANFIGQLFKSYLTQ